MADHDFRKSDPGEPRLWPSEHPERPDPFTDWEAYAAWHAATYVEIDGVIVDTTTPEYAAWYAAQGW